MPWPANSTVNISFPLSVYQWNFNNQISINNVTTAINLLNNVYMATQKWISFNVYNGVAAKSNLQIPFYMLTPAMTGTYSYVTIAIDNNSTAYEQCITGINMQMIIANPSTNIQFSIQPLNSMVGVTSIYQLIINSNVPHQSSFDILIGFPSDIQFMSSYNNVSDSCSATGSTCASNIQTISPLQILVSITANNWTTSNSYQSFLMNISFFKNQRSLKSSGTWSFLTQKLINGQNQSIAQNTCTSQVVTPNTLASVLDAANDYYRSNT